MPELSFARYRNGHKFTHYLFRFPAKFHPPALRCLIDRFSHPGDRLLDPFCGSGTLLVEAVVMGRPAVGIDIDPVASFMSRVKARPILPKALKTAVEVLKEEVDAVRRPKADYDRLMHEDFPKGTVERFRDRFDIPLIPNIDHWFRRYVTIDLARLRLAITGGAFAADVRRFFLACFASIIRNASNADPVPVSGLEVTAHMRKLDKRGRRIDPFELFERKVEKEIQGMEDLWEKAKDVPISVRTGDAARLGQVVAAGSIDAVITSPPYNTAVDYYRRHTLEMYWLNFVRCHEERLELAPKYLGRTQVRKGNTRLRWEPESAYLKGLIKHAEAISPARARALKHYAASMERALSQIARSLKSRGRAVIVVGNAKWNGRRVRPTKLLEELAQEKFKVLQRLSYSTQNRYMSYSRHNGADVSREHVLVLQKRT